MAKKYEVVDMMGTTHLLSVDDGVVPQIDKKERILVVGPNLFSGWITCKLIPPAEVPSINILKP